MGEGTDLLLVGRASPRSPPCCLRVAGRHRSERLLRRDYDSFFLWAGVKPPAALGQAKSVYILAGEVRAGRQFALRAAAARRRRARAMPRSGWCCGSSGSTGSRRSPGNCSANWRAGRRREPMCAGCRSISIPRRSTSIAMRSSSRRLKRELPKGTRLSVTGLMDWSANGDPAALAKLGAVVDEVVVQTYQGRSHHPRLPALPRLALRSCACPTRLRWSMAGNGRAAGLAADPHFKGYVVFLLPGGRARAGKCKARGPYSALGDKEWVENMGQFVIFHFRGWGTSSREELKGVEVKEGLYMIG